MIQTIDEKELIEYWPKDESGRFAAELLQKFLIGLSMESAFGASCLEQRAQAEAAVNKVHANLFKVISKITIEKKEKKKGPSMPQLNRFKESDNNPTENT